MPVAVRENLMWAYICARGSQRVKHFSGRNLLLKVPLYYNFNFRKLNRNKIMICKVNAECKNI